MDDDYTELIEQLLAVIAGVMEDASAAILIQSSATKAERIALTKAAGDQIQALSAAATALVAQAER